MKIKTCAAIVLTISIASASPASARKKVEKKEHGKTYTIAKYSPATGRKLMMSAADPKLFRRLLHKAVPEFKVNATPKKICYMRGAHIDCEDDYDNGICPTEITLDIDKPVRRQITAKVTCTGPDSTGWCDCEFDE